MKNKENKLPDNEIFNLNKVDYNKLWTYNDLSKFLQVSENTLRRNVMYRRIPFIKIGKSVRFDIKQVAEFFKFKIHEKEQTPKEHVMIKHPTAFENEIATWLIEKSRVYKFADLGVKIIIHDGEIKRIEHTIVEKIQK